MKKAKLRVERDCIFGVAIETFTNAISSTVKRQNMESAFIDGGAVFARRDCCRKKGAFEKASVKKSCFFVRLSDLRRCFSIP